MDKKGDKKMTEEEKIIREKARQALKKNKTPSYSSEDEGGIMAGPESKEDFKKDIENDE
ncbi:hypothetical protein ACG1BZ_00830 [Microbulbifer sp. CNSA002]|uniref:hypothetical protein n=1 Tax=Microbulbifer sp. CNSA002 TaxID=3373604 RepID=UPI0039B48139